MIEEFPPEHWENCAQQARALAESLRAPECQRILREIAAGYEYMAEAARRFRQYGAAIEGIGAASPTLDVKSALS